MLKLVQAVEWCKDPAIKAAEILALTDDIRYLRTRAAEETIASDLAASFRALADRLEARARAMR